MRPESRNNILVSQLLTSAGTGITSYLGTLG